MDVVGIVTVVSSIASLVLPLYFLILKLYRDVTKIKCYMLYVFGARLDPPCNRKSNK